MGEILLKSTKYLLYWKTILLAFFWCISFANR